LSPEIHRQLWKAAKMRKKAMVTTVTVASEANPE